MELQFVRTLLLSHLIHFYSMFLKTQGVIFSMLSFSSSVKLKNYLSWFFGWIKFKIYFYFQDNKIYNSFEVDLWPHWCRGNKWNKVATKLNHSPKKTICYRFVKLSIAERLHFYLTNELTAHWWVRRQSKYDKNMYCDCLNGKAGILNGISCSNFIGNKFHSKHLSWPHTWFDVLFHRYKQCSWQES